MSNYLRRSIFVLLIFLLLLSSFGGSISGVKAGAPTFQEDFETDGNGTRYTVTEECTDGSSDFFTRTDGTNIGSWVEYASPNNTYFWAAMDTNGDPCTLSTETITWTGIDISGYISLTFSGLFAEDDDGTNQDWDDLDYVYIEVNIDGGGYQKILQFAAPGTGYNMEPAEDTDFDGFGDGTALTDTFSEFIGAISGTGSTLDLRITTQLDSGDEDIAFDLLKISGETPAFLSEFQPNPAGTDPTNVSFELSGTPSTAFDLWILSIENDGYNGLVDRVSNVTGVFDINGLAVVSIPDLENPSFTVILTDFFTGSTSTDIDPANNGTLDLSTLGTILDAVGVSDSASDDATLYGVTLGGADILYNGQYEPLLAFRDGTTGDWYNTVTR